MKKCITCNEIKSDNNFRTFKRIRKDRGNKEYIVTRGECKKCESNYQLNIYKIDKYGVVQKKKLKMLINKAKALALFNNKCYICEGTFHPAAMDFHHTTNDKKANITSILWNNWDKIEIELKKCILLCANCHRTYHYIEHRYEFKFI